jgi:hypothetical protein
VSEILRVDRVYMVSFFGVSELIPKNFEPNWMANWLIAALHVIGGFFHFASFCLFLGHSLFLSGCDPPTNFLTGLRGAGLVGGQERI